MMLMQFKKSLPGIGFQQLKMFLPSPSKKVPSDSDETLPELSSSAYKLLDPIAEGGFSKVYVGQKRGNMPYKMKYAIKVCDLHRSQEEEQKPKPQPKPVGSGRFKPVEFGAPWIREADVAVDEKNCRVVLPTPLEAIKEELVVLRHLQRSSYVVTLHDAFQVKPTENDWKAWVVMERMEMSLEEVLEISVGVAGLTRKERLDNGLTKTISLVTCACVILEVLKGLRSLKRMRVVHRDIKPGNILLSHYGKIKLCDFGISTIIEEGQSHAVVENIQGTPQYMASEMVHTGQKFDYSSDIWSLGIVLFNLYKPGKMPWLSEKPKEQYFEHHFMWKMWGISNEMYFSRLLCKGFLTGEEYVTSLRQSGLSVDEPKDRMRATKRYKNLEPIAQIVRRAMVPQPKHGPSGEIRREGLMDRLTLDEFVAWCEETVKDTPELKRRTRLKNLVKSKMKCRTYLQLQEESENQKDLLITL